MRLLTLLVALGFCSASYASLTPSDLVFLSLFNGEYKSEDGSSRVQIMNYPSTGSHYMLIQINAPGVDRDLEIFEDEDETFMDVAEKGALSLSEAPVESWDPDMPDLPGVELELKLSDDGKPIVILDAENQSNYIDFSDLIAGDYDDYDQDLSDLELELLKDEASFNQNYFEAICIEQGNNDSYVDWDRFDSDGMECVTPISEQVLSKI